MEFKVLIADSTWQIGANNKIILPSQNSYVNIYPWFYTTSGRLSYINNVYSPQLQNTRNIIIYTPPSYDENPYKFAKNVLIMHDGQNLVF